MSEAKLDLIVVFKIMPDGAEVDIEALGKSVLETTQKVAPSAKVQNIEFKPIAFGLKSVEATVLMSDGEGGPDPLEEAFNELEGVGSATVAQLGRI